jgi:MFS family permease
MGRISDRFGARTMIVATLLLWETSNLVWLVVTPEWRWIFYPLWLWGGAMGGGYLLANFALLLKLVPRHLKTTGISLNLGLTSVAGAVAPILAGLAITWAVNAGLEERLALRTIFGIKSAIVFSAIFIILPLAEPQVSRQFSAAGAMRTMRLLATGQGFTALANVALARKPRRAKR